MQAIPSAGPHATPPAAAAARSRDVDAPTVTAPPPPWTRSRDAQRPTHAAPKPSSSRSSSWCSSSWCSSSSRLPSPGCSCWWQQQVFARRRRLRHARWPRWRVNARLAARCVRVVSACGTCLRFAAATSCAKLGVLLITTTHTTRHPSFNKPKHRARPASPASSSTASRLWVSLFGCRTTAAAAATPPPEPPPGDDPAATHATQADYTAVTAAPADATTVNDTLSFHGAICSSICRSRCCRHSNTCVTHVTSVASRHASHASWRSAGSARCSTSTTSTR